MEPDIVLVMTDQQRHDQVGFASGGFFETPNLDTLAARGVRFDCAYSASSTCVPARNALLTGVQPHRLPRGEHLMALRPGTWTVARALRAAGYETALVGKMHFTPMHADHGFDLVRTSEHLGASVHGLRPDGSPDVDDYHQWLVDEGVAEWERLVPGEPPAIRPRPAPPGLGHLPFPHELRYHATTWVEAQAHAALDRRSGDRPLFLVVSFPHPHTPINPLGPYATRYDPADTPLPADDLSVNDSLPEPFRSEFTDSARRYRPWLVHERGTEALRRRQTDIRALVAHIDDAMGRIVERLDLDRTVIAFTTDHGDYGGHRGVASKMPWIPFDDLVRVPLVLAGAGVAGGRREAAVVQSSDLALTFCDLAGVAAPGDELDSRSLRPFLEDRAGPADRARPAVFATTMGFPGARLGSKKLILHPGTWTSALFDLDEDPGETVNLAGDPACRAEEEALGDVLRATFARPRWAGGGPGAGGADGS